MCYESRSFHIGEKIVSVYRVEQGMEWVVGGGSGVGLIYSLVKTGK